MTISFVEILHGLISGETADMDVSTLRKVFAPDKTEGVVDEAMMGAVIEFAREHRCNFSFDERMGKGKFSKK